MDNINLHARTIQCLNVERSDNGLFFYSNDDNCRICWELNETEPINVYFDCQFKLDDYYHDKNIPLFFIGNLGDDKELDNKNKLNTFNVFYSHSHNELRLIYHDKDKSNHFTVNNCFILGNSKNTYRFEFLVGKLNFYFNGHLCSEISNVHLPRTNKCFGFGNLTDNFMGCSRMYISNLIIQQGNRELTPHDINPDNYNGLEISCKTLITRDILACNIDASNLYTTKDQIIEFTGSYTGLSKIKFRYFNNTVDMYIKGFTLNENKEHDNEVIEANVSSIGTDFYPTGKIYGVISSSSPHSNHPIVLDEDWSIRIYYSYWLQEFPQNYCGRAIKFYDCHISFNSWV